MNSHPVPDSLGPHQKQDPLPRLGIGGRDDGMPSARREFICGRSFCDAVPSFLRSFARPFTAIRELEKMQRKPELTAHDGVRRACVRVANAEARPGG